MTRRKNSIDSFVKDNSKKLATISTKALKQEIENREANPNYFPLEVFPAELHPLINEMKDEDKLDLPPEFVGLAILSSYSVAIGTAYMVKTSFPDPVCMAIFGCFVGISSAGKSATTKITHKPISELQDEFDMDYEEKKESVSEEAAKRIVKKTVLLRDSRMSTLLSSVMPQNPKGLYKDHDEILEWVKGMNAGNKNGVGNEEEIWMAMWNAQRYNKQLADNKYYNIPRMYANILAGIQPIILHELFSKNRAHTGFVFRLLFAMPVIHKKPRKNIFFEMDKNTLDVHKTCVKFLYKELPIEDPYLPPKILSLEHKAKVILNEWMNRKTNEMNTIKDIDLINIMGGILGKMDEYVYRFAGILCLMDKAFYLMKQKMHMGFDDELLISENQIMRAIQVTEYFEKSALECYQLVTKKLIASDDALEMASMTRANWTLERIAERIFNEKITEANTRALCEKARRIRKKLISEFPNAFGAKNT
jgi:hypothetical protein